jgi:hypothetical protein
VKRLNRLAEYSAQQIRSTCRSALARDKGRRTFCRWHAGYCPNTAETKRASTGTFGCPSAFRLLGIQRGLNQLLRGLQQVRDSHDQFALGSVELFSRFVGSSRSAVEDFAGGGQGFFGADVIADQEQSVRESVLGGARGAGNVVAVCLGWGGSGVTLTMVNLLMSQATKIRC